jgi:hypothetical protein
MGVRGDRGGQDSFGNLTSVARAPRETIDGRAPVSQGVTNPVSRGTITSGVPTSRPQTSTSRAPQTQASPKPTVTSTLKTPTSQVGADKLAAKPVTAKPTTAPKPITTKAPVTAKTTVKTPAVSKAPVTSKLTTPTKTPVSPKTTTPTKTPIAAKTTTPVTKTPAVSPVKTTTPTTKTTKPTSSLTSTLKNAAIGAGTAALINSLVNKTKTSTSPVSTKPTGIPASTATKTTGIPTTTKPIGIPTTKTTGTPTTTKPAGIPTSVLKPPVTKPTSTAKKAATSAITAKAATTGATTDATEALTEEEIQDELDRVKLEEEANVIPEDAVVNEDGSYSVIADGMVTTYDANGNIIGMEAVEDDTTVEDTTGEDTTVDDTIVDDTSSDTTALDTSLTEDDTESIDTTLTTDADTSAMTDLGEGYFADADGNIYGADGNLMYTIGEDGEYVDASAVDDTFDETTYTDPETGDVYNLGADGNWTLEGGDSSTEDVTSWTDPDTGETWNLGADGEWSQEGVDADEITSWTDPDTGETWNLGADGEWNQEGVDDTLVDDTLLDDTLLDDESFDDTYVADDEYVDDGTNYEEDAKGGSIVKKYKRNARRFLDGGLNSLGYGDDEGYSDTGEEVQDFQNVGYNYGEFDDPSMTGDLSLYSQNEPMQNTYLRSTSLAEPEGWPAGFVDNGDGTATYVDDDGSTMTIDADNNIVFTTDSEGNVFNSEVGEPVSGNYPVQGITSSGSGNRPSFATAASEAAVGQRTQSDQSGVLDSLLNFVRDNPGMAGGAIGALISSLMDQAGSSESASPSQPVDISELTSFNPRTTDFGAGMVGGRTGTGSPIVSYSDYSEGGGDEIIDDRLYSDLGISGYLREPDMSNYRDEEGNLTDQSGNLVDEYGYLLEDGGYEEEPQEEYIAEDMAEEEPAMAGGGTTHYTFGRVMNPAENLGLAEGMKKGGLSQAHTVHSHQTNPVVNNRVDFRKGSAVNGAGDGQSDDIPAWLADGEYVMDAELVSMLGNGSNKAGAKVLDKFRENIRAHKRGAPLGKIPPKAKSPLNYLKESMNG